jgi:signal transduction histidine kinase
MESQDKDLAGTGAELSTILAHEIKNPMNSIIINMEVLRSALLEVTNGIDSPASQRAKKYLDVIEGEIRRLDKVIKGFLDFASPQQSTKINFQLNLVIQSLVDFMNNEMRQKKIFAKLELDSTLPPILGSSDQIRQALLNLMINALQAMPNGGTITLRTFQTNDQVCVSIEDTGEGIDDRNRSNIFNPYFTTKAKGSGLGLTIVRRVIKEHQGEIHMKSEVGKGTQFTLCFPNRSPAK